MTDTPSQPPTIQVNPDNVIARAGMLLLGLSSFHPAELEVTIQVLKQSETRAKLDPSAPLGSWKVVRSNRMSLEAILVLKRTIDNQDAHDRGEPEAPTILFPNDGRPS